MIRSLHVILLALVFLSLTKVARADPPRASHDHWRNTQYAGHYILYDNASRSYVETVNCRVMWRFTVRSNEMNTLTLYDASRNMLVRLTYDGMYLKESGANDFTLYQRGTFDTRKQFRHHDASGNYTGAITKGHGCSWVEYLAGAKSPSFRFVESASTNGYVDIYDSSRSMTVRMDNSRMYLKVGNGAFGYFKDGTW